MNIIFKVHKNSYWPQQKTIIVFCLAYDWTVKDEWMVKWPWVSWSWSYGSWVYNYLYNLNQCLSPLKLWVWSRSWWGVLDTPLCDKVCQWPAAGRCFSPCTLLSSTNKTDCHDITEILLKVALNTITITIFWILNKISYIHAIWFQNFQVLV